MQSLKEYPKMWLYDSVTEVDLKLNKALHKAKRAITMDPKDLKEKVNINAAGQEAIEADVLSEQIFYRTLIDEGLSGTMYSEESGVKTFGTPEENDDNSLSLIIDPLDGSQNYLKGIPFGCISVAYGPYQESPTLGDLTSASIMNLYTNEELYAATGYGAYKNGLELPHVGEFNLSHFTNRSIQMSYYAYGSRASQYYFDFQQSYSLRSLGSAAWEMALVADNRNDAFADIRGVLKTHDFAAARLIIRELGGEVQFIGVDPEEVDNLPLDDFKSGYSVLASLDQHFLKFLINEFASHGLISAHHII